MARTNRNQVQAHTEALGYLNIYVLSRKTGAKKKIAWQVIEEGTDLATIAPKIGGTFTRDDGVTIEINWNPVSEEEFEL